MSNISVLKKFTALVVILAFVGISASVFAKSNTFPISGKSSYSMSKANCAFKSCIFKSKHCKCKKSDGKCTCEKCGCKTADGKCDCPNCGCKSADGKCACASGGCKKADKCEHKNNDGKCCKKKE